MGSEAVTWASRFIESLGLVLRTIGQVLEVVGSQLFRIGGEYGGAIALFGLFYLSYLLLRAGLNIPRRNYREIGSRRRQTTPASRLMKFTVPGVMLFLCGVLLLVLEVGGAHLMNLVTAAIVIAGIALSFQGARMSAALRGTQADPLSDQDARMSAPLPGTQADPLSGWTEADPLSDSDTGLGLLGNRSIRAAAIVAAGLLVVLVALSSLNGRARDLGEGSALASRERVEAIDAQLGDLVGAVRNALNAPPESDTQEAEVSEEAAVAASR